MVARKVEMDEAEVISVLSTVDVISFVDVFAGIFSGVSNVISTVVPRGLEEVLVEVKAIDVPLVVLKVVFMEAEVSLVTVDCKFVEKGIVDEVLKIELGAISTVVEKRVVRERAVEKRVVILSLVDDRIEVRVVDGGLLEGMSEEKWLFEIFSVMSTVDVTLVGGLFVVIFIAVSNIISLVIPVTKTVWVEVLVPVFVCWVVPMECTFVDVGTVETLGGVMRVVGEVINLLTFKVEMVDNRKVEGGMVDRKVVGERVVKRMVVVEAWGIKERVDESLVEERILVGRPVEERPVEDALVEGGLVEGGLVEGGLVEGELVEGGLVEGMAVEEWLFEILSVIPIVEVTLVVRLFVVIFIAVSNINFLVLPGGGTAVMEVKVLVIVVVVCCLVPVECTLVDNWTVDKVIRMVREVLCIEVIKVDVTIDVPVVVINVSLTEVRDPVLVLSTLLTCESKK